MDWKEQYPKETKPSYDELLAFFEPGIRALFLSFDQAMRERFRVHNKNHRFSSAAGWTYGYGRSYSCELLSVTVRQDAFRMLRVTVVDEASLLQALEKTQAAYDAGFEARYAEASTKKRADQVARAKRRTEKKKPKWRS